MLNQRFKTKTNMARELNAELRTIQKTFSQLERNTSKGGRIVLERILGYCAQNNISIDEVITMYREKKQMMESDKAYVNFPMPEGMDERVMDVYCHANTYVQCVAGHLCPLCKKGCHPIRRDKWLWSDCMVSWISMIMLSHILLVQDDVRAHRPRE